VDTRLGKSGKNELIIIVMIQKSIRLQILAGILLLYPACMWAQSDEGIGINMDSAPIGAFQLNGSDASRQADDVVINSEGLVGIGTVAPTARLTIDTQGASGVYPIRVRDGSQGNARIMVAEDDEGHASWKTITPPVPDVLYPLTTLSTSVVGYNVGTASKVTTSELTVTENGFYSIDVRWWVDFNNSSISTLQESITRFQLRKNDVVVIDEIKYHEVTRYRWTAFFVLYATAQAGDKLALYVLPEVYPTGATQLQIGTLATNDWCRSKVRYKKLGIGNANLFN
jgi:hypothetical protein